MIWEKPEPAQQLNLADFVVKQLVDKIRNEKLLIEPAQILKIALIACENAETGIPS